MDEYRKLEKADSEDDRRRKELGDAKQRANKHWHQNAG